MKKKILLISSLLLLLIVVFMRSFYVWDTGFPDRTGQPIYSSEQLELVANLEFPPANIAVSKEGRVFVTLHPEGKPNDNLGEIVDGTFISWPENSSQNTDFKAPKNAYGIRIDQQNRLWVLDNYPARLLTFDLDTGKLLEQYLFSNNEFPFASHANDLQVSNDGNFIYISDDGLYNHKPAIVVYDVRNKIAWRHLESHLSTEAGPFTPVVQGVPMTMLGLFSINPGIDGLTLSRDNKWLYYASFSSDYLYRVPVSELNKQDDFNPISVESVSLKTFTDGMTSDLQGNIYLSDIEHSAVMRVNSEFQLETVVKTNKLRWPDGFSFDNNGYLYITASSLHQVILKSAKEISANGPYQIYRIMLGKPSIAGH